MTRVGLVATFDPVGDPTGNVVPVGPPQSDDLKR